MICFSEEAPRNIGNTEQILRRHTCLCVCIYIERDIHVDAYMYIETMDQYWRSSSAGL